MLLPLLSLSLVGCDTIQGLLGKEPPPPAAAPAPPKDLSAQRDDVRGLLRSGKAKQALAAAEALLAAHPEDDGVWDLVELAGLRAGAAAELVDHLSADKAVGGRAERHHVLRGMMAVEANRLGDALNSARALQDVAPGDAAAIVALAVAKGAPLPEDASSGAKALAAAADASKPLDPAVDALPGWRAALVRGEARLARGDRAGAALDAAAADAGGPRAKELGALLRVRAATSGDEAWAAAEPAARAAVADGDAQGAAEILDAALPGALTAWKAGDLASLATELRGTVTTAGDTDAAARIAAVEADAAVRAGRPIAARDAAKVAAAVPAVQVRASWALALASAALGAPADVDAAAAALAEPRAAAAKDLARALRGESPTLPTAGLTGADAALQALLGAGWSASPGPVYAAAAEAAGTDAPDLSWWARLAADRKPLSVPADAAPGLLAEEAARAWLASGSGAVPASDHPEAAGWAALAGGTVPAADAPGAVAAWARASAAIDAGKGADAAKELATVAAPAWRSGPWAPLLALDGPVPADLDGLAARNLRASDPLPFAVAMHGWAAHARSVGGLWQIGTAPFPPAATADQRAAVWDAVAAARAGTLAWVAGRGAWPADRLAALETAEKAAGLVRTPPPSLSALRGTLDGDVIISFREAGKGLEALYLGEEKGLVKMLPASLESDTKVLLSKLHSGDSAVPAADHLREIALDPAADVLTGVGRYMVIGPAPVGLFPVPALPEQADGLRFLAAIRHVGYLPDFEAVLPAPPTEFEPTVTMLALCATPDEATTVRHVFPDAKALVGAEATGAAFMGDLGKARFVYVGEFPAAPGGGFKLADGPFSLSKLSGVAIGATAVALPGGEEPDVIAARVAAFRAAGAKDVLVEAWTPEAGLRDRLVTHFWEGINRRYSATRALSEARMLTVREIGEEARLPASWAGYLVSGRP